MKSLYIRFFLLLLLAVPFASTNAQQGDNNFTVDLNMLTRGELRYGGFNQIDQSLDGHAHFIIGRYRLTTDYSNSWLETKVTLQHSGTWGMAGGSFTLYEGWAAAKSPKGFFAKFGRQVLSYDDERIIGSNDWSVTAPTHDVLKVGFENTRHKVHLLFAYNQNPENMEGFTYYNGGNQPYKSMQTAWYHYDSPNNFFGGSLLFMNIGMQGQKNNVAKDYYQQLAGTYLNLNHKYFLAEGSFYYQFGTEEHGIPLDAYMGSVKLTVKPRTTYNIYAGYDYLSGDAYFAVPPEGQIGVVFHDKVRGFNPIYGSHHEFYGAMDFFYMSAYVGGFTPGLQNAFIGTSFSPAKNSLINLAAHYYAIATDLPGLDKSLGYEFDISLNYAFTKYLTAECGYSYMYGTETMKSLKRVSDSQHLHWAYLMLVVNPTLFTTKW